MGRISTFLASEDLPEPYPVDYKSPAAVQVDGDFVWETVYDAVTKEKAGNQGFGTPGAGGIGGRRGGKGDGLGDKENGRGNKGNKGRKSAKKGKTEGDVLPTTIADLGKDEAMLGEEKDKDEGAEHPFELNNLKFVIPQGAFVAIIGRVGCGKVQINLLAIM